MKTTRLPPIKTLNWFKNLPEDVKEKIRAERLKDLQSQADEYRRTGDASVFHGGCLDIDCSECPAVELCGAWNNEGRN